mgnify:FL=1
MYRIPLLQITKLPSLYRLSCDVAFFILLQCFLSACSEIKNETKKPALASQASPKPPTEQQSIESYSAPVSSAQFIDVSKQAGLIEKNVSGSPEQGYIGETMSAGVAVFDANGDGYLDFFLTGGDNLSPPSVESSQHLYINNQDGTFRNKTKAAGLSFTGWGMGSAVGDSDNDGDVDLYVTYLGKNRLYLNSGDATFSEIAEFAGVADAAWGASAAWGDLDNDGLLDLYVANYVEFDFETPPTGPLKCKYKGLDTFCGPMGMASSSDRLYRNEGNNTFADLSDETSVSNFFLPALGVVLADVDNDADLDIYVANDSERNLFFENMGNWNFRENAVKIGLAYSEEGRAQAGMGVDAADFDDDGDVDIIVTNFSDDVNTLYANNGKGVFADHTYAAGLGSVVRPYLGWSTQFFDFDNDGDLDLYVANGHIYPQLMRLSDGLRYAQKNLLYRNDDGFYTHIEGGPGWQIEKVSRGGATFDYDNDGDLDLIFNNLNDTADLLRNDTQHTNDWVGLQLIGIDSNRGSIGARVVAKTNRTSRTRYVSRGRGFQSQSDVRLIFGLAAGEKVDTLLVTWPSGTTHTLTDPPHKNYIRLNERGESELIAFRKKVTAQYSQETLTDTTPLSSGRLRTESDASYQSNWSALDFAKAGKDFYEQGQYDAAKRTLEKAVLLAPENIAIQVNLAMVFFQGMGDYEKTVDLLLRTTRSAPSNHHAHALLGRAYLKLNHLQKARESLKNAASIDSLNWKLYNWLGVSHMRSSNMEEALSSFTRATKLAPWQPTPHLHLSRVFADLGDTRQAQVAEQNFKHLRPLQEDVERFKKNVTLFPDSTRAHTLLGLAYTEQGRRKPAIDHFKEAIRLDSLYAPAYHGLGKLYMLYGRTNSAIHYLEKAHEIDLTFGPAAFDLAQAYFRIKEFQKSIGAYTHALSIDSRHDVIKTNLAMAYAMEGNLREAKQLFYEVIKSNNGNVDARDGLAQILLSEGNKQDALEQWKHILTIDPNHRRATAAVRDL